MRLSLFLAACLLPLTATAADGKLSLNVGAEYTSGDYGDSSNTDTWALPIGLKYRTGTLTLRLATSWLHVSGPGNVTPEGEPIGGSSTSTTEEGMGDVITSLTWNALDERDYALGLDVGAKVKFGTADENKSLGTGENDYSLHAEIFKPVDAWFPFLKLGYTWKGDPAGIDYRNVWFGSAGTDYRLSKTYSLGAYYDWRQKLTSSSDPISEATLYLNTRINDSNKLNVYLIKGFSDASPDWGAGLALNHGF